MAEWFKKRLGSLLDKLIFTVLLAGGAAMWAALKSLPIWMIVAIAWGMCLVILFSIKLVVMRSLSFTILNNAEAIEEPTGVSFKTRLKILKKLMK